MAKNTLYLAITNDKYEHIINVEETGVKMAQWAEIRLCHLYTYIKKGTYYKKANCIFTKITVEENLHEKY